MCVTTPEQNGLEAPVRCSHEHSSTQILDIPAMHLAITLQHLSMQDGYFVGWFLPVVVCVHTHMHVYVCMHAFMCMCAHRYIHMHTHTHTHTHTLRNTFLQNFISSKDGRIKSMVGRQGWKHTKRLLYYKAMVEKKA